MAECALCRRTLSSENENTDLDSITICGDCKFLFLEDNATPSQHIQQITSRIRQTRYESIEEMFSHQFSTMVNLARQNPTPSDYRRWRRAVSNNENNSFDFEAYGGESEVFVDMHSDSPLGGDSDTDIDPMHVGLNLNLNQWSSDDEWEEVEDGVTDENPLGSLISRVHLQRSMAYNGQTSENRSYPFGNPGDYLDSRSFEELLERLAEADGSRRGAPPAAQSVVNNLDRVTVNASNHNGLACAICKDLLTVGTVVNQLPCLHLYHPSCIKPWLNARNTCPLCRFELPTDDVDYENMRVSGSHGPIVQETRPSYEEDGGGQEILNNDGGGGQTGGGWWLFVAAPVMSLVGIGLALWLGNSRAIRSYVSRGDKSKRGWVPF